MTLFRKTETGIDEMLDPIWDWVPERIENVIWEQAAYDNQRIADPTRPNGIDVGITVHLPKTYTQSVRGCEFEIMGARWSVIGDPVGYMEHLTPGPWNRPVPCRRADG